MADEMANGNNFDPQARYAALDERVTNLRTSFVNLEGEMRSGFATINSHLSSVSNELRASTKTQWPVIWMAAAVVVAILGGVGTILYTPVKSDVAKLQDNSITRSEWDDNMARGAENRQRLENALMKLAENAIGRNELTQMVTEYRDYKARVEGELNDKVPRNEWSERNLNRDHEIANLQRQLDVQRTDFQTFANSLGNGRDFILDLKTELGRLRDQLAEIRSRQYQRGAGPSPVP